jgi:cyclase
VNRTLIVARIAPGAQEQVAGIFARSDQSELPGQLGVQRRALYTFHELYLHVIDFDRPSDEAMRTAATLPAFRQISEELSPYITAYDPTTWSSPRDAMASCFYDWTPPPASTRASVQAATTR